MFLIELLMHTSIRNTTNGSNRPGSNQTSIIFKYEVWGNADDEAWYKVYMTNMEVNATIVVASKWDSSMNKVISAANNKHTDGKYVVAM